MSWRDDEWARISALAGLDPDGGILPPPAGQMIDRSPTQWWRNPAYEPPLVRETSLTIEAPYPGWPTE